MFFGQKISEKTQKKISGQNFFRTRIFLTKNYFHTKTFWDPKFCPTQNLFGLKKNSDPKFLCDQTFLSDLIFFLPKIQRFRMLETRRYRGEGKSFSKLNTFNLSLVFLLMYYCDSLASPILFVNINVLKIYQPFSLYCCLIDIKAFTVHLDNLDNGQQK